MKPLGEMVREAREAKGMTQGKLARALEVDAQTISNLETGRTRTLKFSKLEPLAKALGLPLADVIEAARVPTEPTSVVISSEGKRVELSRELLSQLEQNAAEQKMALSDYIARVLAFDPDVIEQSGKSRASRGRRKRGANGGERAKHAPQP